eukprot:s189_g16.t4
MSSTGEHCRHLERHLLPAAHRCMEKVKSKLVEIMENYFDTFNASPDASAAIASDDKYNLLRLLLAFLEHENFHARNSPTRTSLPPRMRMALHQMEAKAIHKLKPHLELLDAYRWHQISARRQEQTLSGLRDGGLQPDMLLVQVYALCSQERCASFECGAGYEPKPGTTVGSSTDSCCTPVSCPAGSSGAGVPSGCTCNAGFTGSITKSSEAPFFEGSCDAVACPKNSHGKSVGAGCTCDAGYSGSITATSADPFFSGTCVKTCGLFTCPKGWQPKGDAVVGSTRKACCEPVACPSGAGGKSVADGCKCKKGFSGKISASRSSPYYTGSCTSVDCPANSEGANVPSGRTCEAGYSGTIEATRSAPFYKGECTAVACPANSAGNNVASGCLCVAGFSGTIAKAKASAPLSNLVFGTCTNGPYLQLGAWRLAAMDPNHFSISHRDGQTPMIYRSDGTRHGGPRTEWNAWDCKGAYDDKQVKWGDHFLQLGEFRLGQVDDAHFSISHSGGQTIVIFRSDGTIHPGPRTDFNLWSKPTLTSPTGATSGDRFVQIGKFRLGDVDSGHFSVSHELGQTMQIFRNDGTLHPGPRTDFSTFGREETTGRFYTGSCTAVKCPDHSSGTDLPTGCSCNAGYSGGITATTASPFFSGECKAVACPLHSIGTDLPSGCKCKEGYKGTITATAADPFFMGSCTPVACPAHSTGTNVPGGCECLAGYSGTITGDGSCAAVQCPAGSAGTDLPSGCTCKAGFTGSVVATKTSPFFSGGCKAVACPAHSHGTDVPSGCTCDKGYTGGITATTSSPFFSGACQATCSLFTCPVGFKPKPSNTLGNSQALCCEAVACPSNSKGDDVAKGCTCDAGFTGSVTAIAQSPYYQNGCTAVQCPSDSSGTDVPTGCTCDAGFSGSITASSASPFFTGSCQAVACPKDSSGTNVPSGCTCNAGFSGSVLAIQATPFYTSTCAPVACPSHSTGTDVATGCSCDAGYSGSITASNTSPFYTGSCDDVACPKNAKGVDVPSGCTCKDGFIGSVTASTAAPFYTTTCTAVECPAHSTGADVVQGCTCQAGFSGVIAPAAFFLENQSSGDAKTSHLQSMTTPLWLQALLFGLFSALSLPLGALLGLALAPVSAKVTAQWMAFGGGALVFAVATQLFGESLFRLDASTWIRPGGGKGPGCDERCKELCVNNILQILGAMLGATMYLLLNRWLERGAFAAAKTGEQENRSRPQSEARHLSPIGEDAQTGSLELGGVGVASAGVSNLMPAMGTGSMTLSLRRASTLLEEEEEATSMGSAQVALSMWLGMMLDGIPEALMLGFMTNEGSVTFSFLVAIFIANFPEAFSGSSLLQGQKMPVILLMWMVLFTLTGLLAMIGSLIMPANVARGSDLAKKRDKATALMEGITGGAMLAMVSTAMLPEAFKGAGDKAGLIFVLGFVLSVWITCLGYRYGGPQDGMQGYSGKCTAVACPDHSSGTDIISGCKCNAGYFGAVSAKIGAPFYDGGCTAWGCSPGTGSQCQSCVEQSKRSQADHCATCNEGFYIDEPGCKVMAADQKCGGATCAKSCEGEKCGFKCAGSLFGQEECARDCKGVECGSQCVGGNCASACQGDKCGYECSGGKDVQQCSMGCKGLECGYYCQGTECARQCVGDRCGSYCSGEKGSEGHCAYQCKGRQCGFECIGAMCAAECTGDRCAYRCQGTHEDVGTCGTKAESIWRGCLECAYRCEGSSCAELCEGERCGFGCASGSGSSQTCAKQCKGEECGSGCVGGLCAAQCHGRKCAYQCSGVNGEQQACGSECVGALCAAKCTGAECAKGCKGDFCGKECSGTSGTKSHCAAGCVGRRCAAKCKGAYCAAGCQGVGCANGCEGDHCDDGCTGDHCSKGASPSSTCQEALDGNPNLCGLKSSFKDEVWLPRRAADRASVGAHVFFFLAQANAESSHRSSNI